MGFPNWMRRCAGATALPLFLAALFAVCGASCARFGKKQAQSADKAAYSIIEQKQAEALGESAAFSLEPIDDEAFEQLIAEAGRLAWSQDTYTTPSYLLSLADALAIAFAKSRDYQTRKEELFNRALSLSDTRYDYGPLLSASASGSVTRTDPGNTGDADSRVERYGSGNFGAGVRQSLATGAEVSLRFTKSFVHYITGEPRESSTNNASFSLMQPLLNGAGPLVAREGLRQSERDMIYQVRDYRRYQQGFVITIASAYYQLLQQLDRLNNEYINYKNAQMDIEKASMLAAAGRIAGFEFDQTRQRALDAQNRWTNAQAEYLNRLDRFKMQLGLPLDLDIGPDPREFEVIHRQGLVRPDMELTSAVLCAVSDRLDLKTVEDRLADNERKVEIALRDFLPTLNARYEFSTSRPVDNDTDLSMDFTNNRQTWGLDLSLPLDWTPRRNRYRRALVALEQAKRRLEETHDRVILEVRDAWRQLERSRKSYEIQLMSVALASRRVESVQLLLDSGRATTRDLLDAQDALVTSKNSLTDSLVTHTIRKLEFWNAIERLKIDSRGMWYE